MTEPTTIEVAVPDCWAETKVDRNPVRQLLVPEQLLTIEMKSADTFRATSPDGQWAVLGPHEKYVGWELSIRSSRALTKPVSDRKGSWLGGRELFQPNDVRALFDGAFSYMQENTSIGRNGLRTPQIGALHTVLGYWTTGNAQPATVVMPTGTGKTETMLALLVAGQLERLLVLVPSDALRRQVTSKFETLGVLQRFGIVSERAKRPVVGQVQHGFTEPTLAKEFAEACNVIVATPAALHASTPEARAVLVSACTHMFIDEAHHVGATTWKELRDQFEGKPVVQFTATPYREDGRPLGGRIIYNFPLRQAQQQGYFSHVNYVSVLDFIDTDRAVALRAVDQLRADLARGLDHVLMARVKRIGRALDLHPLYEELAADLKPVVLHSSLTVRERDESLVLVDSRASRIIICVDMLGEGFDMAALKVAAVHDVHKSLAVTLQFVGRFARVADPTIGKATVVVGRPDPDYDVNLRRLYAEDADWNAVLRDLSETAVGDEQEASDFEEAFGSLPEEVALRNLEPKMSTVAYRTTCDSWMPEAVTDVFPEDRLFTYPIAINQRDRVAWFVTKNVQPVRWGDLRTVEEVTYDLYVLYWDETRQLLFINSSNTGSVYEGLALAVGGEATVRITGEQVYRVMARITRLVATNVGVLDYRNRERRFSLHVGADVIEGFPISETQTKTQTNIFASGYDHGARVSLGASLKGRIWSNRAADTVKQWVDWCDYVGNKLTDESISVDDVMRGFIRPKVVDERPPYVPLALEWSWPLYASVTEELKLSHGGRLWPVIDSDLVVTSQSTSGPLTFRIETPKWSADYAIQFTTNGMLYTALGDELTVTDRRASLPLSDFLKKSGLTILFEKDITVEPPGLLLQPDRDMPPFERDRLHVLDWPSIKKESQGKDRDPESIQARVLRHIKDTENWDLVVDDDGKGEVADVVGMRVDGESLVVRMIHCKYSKEEKPGARLDDLYEVCGQAQKSRRWRRDVVRLFQHLIRREKRRQKDGGRTGIEVGTPQRLYELEEESRLLLPKFEVWVVQPGLSKQRVTDEQLELLACTEVFLHETANASLTVWCS